GFDAGRVSRLEVYDALQAHADFAVASSQPAREPGWHYESLLGDLFTEPLVAPGDLAQAMAQRYVDFRSGERGDAYVNMMAVDLARFGAVSGALEALAGVLQDELPVALSDVVAARQAAGVGGGATIDLHRFAAALSQHSAHRRVVEASGALLRALDDVVLLQARGVRLPEAGDIAFYFPQRGSPQGAGEFAEAGAAPAWAEFLVAYYEAAGEHGAPPLVSAALRDEGAASAQRPAYVDLEIGGWHMETVTAAVARREEEGRLRLLAHDALTPNPAGPGDESAPWYWPSGVSEEFYVWDTTAAYVSDGANGDFAPLWPVAAHGELLAVAGQYVAPGEDEGREASLVFEADTGQLHAVWGYDEGASPPRPIGPQMGAGFQVYNHYLGDERAISYEPGVTLVFTEGAAFTYDHYPLPGGDYVLQFAAESAGGRVAEAQAAVAVDNEALTPGLQAYLDPYYGFQFLYPLTWPAPAYESGQLAAVDAEGDRRFSVSLWPQTTDAAALKQAALETFGAVTVLYETQATAGGETALLTAYGYEAEGESRTGVLATFGHGGRDLGVVVDLDGPATGEAETMALMDAVLSGWQFRPVGLDAAPGGWTRREVGGLDMAVPSDYAYERLENGWERLSSGDVFLALRTEPASGMGRPAIVARWLEVAGNGVEGFEAGAPQRFALAGAGWSRADFSYESSGAIVRGLLMATIVDSREVVAWVEAPDAGFQQLESNVFLVMLADAVAAAMGGAGESGLLYEETFDEEGSWGAGGVEGAAAAVTGGAYNLSVSAEQGFFWATAGQSFADGVFEVDAVQTEGPLDNGYGLLLRASAEQEAFYALEISGDGFVWIGRCEDGCARPTTLVGEGWFYSGAVRQGLDARNRLR
ncbi:MAG TPA: hypothetical protein VK879_06660, partial [Candidatus Sulfomarinibacteraceae bacterium]|nr:hypothetical protein [Candidatus Sulfomarinibacteraceae bacterium]